MFTFQEAKNTQKVSSAHKAISMKQVESMLNKLNYAYGREIKRTLKLKINVNELKISGGWLQL